MSHQNRQRRRARRAARRIGRFIADIMENEGRSMAKFADRLRLRSEPWQHSGGTVIAEPLRYKEVVH
jgi:hypothetical protein